MKYLATINVPGYVPMDDDPPTFDTAREAWQYLADERRRAEDDALDLSVGFGEQDEGYSATVTELDKYARWAGSGLVCDFEAVGTVWGETPGGRMYDLGLAYHVTVCEPCEEHAEGEDGRCTVCGADFTATEVS